MNYYTTPNYMNSYSYNQYPYMQQQQQIPQQFNMQTPQPQSIAAAAQGLNGKIVDGEDVVKATEVPIGGYGVFPKADLSEIYLKTWNNNGTTSIVKFRPVIEQSQAETVDSFTQLMQRIDDIDNKLDSFIKKPQQQQQHQQKSEVMKKNGF